MRNFLNNIVILLSFVIVSCSKSESKSYLLAPDSDNAQETVCLSLSQMARIFAALPIEDEQMQEVHAAVNGSMGKGYDEEYTLQNLLSAPGCGLGEKATKATPYKRPLRDLLSEYLNRHTKADDGPSPEQILRELENSDYQIYWPYSEEWDGKTMPVITYDPVYTTEYNYGYRMRRDKTTGQIQVDTILVDEAMAMETPVWVINNNRDAESTPILAFTPETHNVGQSGLNRILRMKSFTMLRHYDPWFKGGSEFSIKCGSINGFVAQTEAELNLYNPSISDFTVVVKRKDINKRKDYDAILLTNFTNQLDQLAFLVTEDDGGTMTSWKCSAVVKIKSKSYGFEVDLPFREKDDIVWRGQLSASYFQSQDVVTGRFGDVEISFQLDD